MISLIVGLGNIGTKYAGTRHNLGFEVLDIIFKKWRLRRRREHPLYTWAEKEFHNRKIRLIWPTTYMNNSGAAVSQAMADFELNLDEILVIVDDYNLPLGKMRIRKRGSDGGHNGLESIISHLGSGEFMRLRLGIGPIPENIGSIDYVLGRFPETETEKVKKMLEKAGDAVLYLLTHRPEEAMSIYNSDPAPDESEKE